MNKVAARTGVLTYQANMDVIANNMANVNTNGFKPFRASLADLIYTTRDYQNEDTNYGHGVRVQKNDFMYEQGARHDTGLALDFYAGDDAFFSVEDVNGDRFYTKAGAFQISQTTAPVYDEEGNLTAAPVWELVDPQNGFVLNAEGGHITIPFLTNPEGQLTSDIDYNALEDMIGLFTFDNPYGIRAVGDNYFAVTESSGEAIVSEDAELIRGALERSEVDIATEMTELMITQRAFSLNINMLKTYNEMTTLVNNIKS
ncbi:MAG: flagellar hook-basal body protein [Ruminococcus sp.]|jgi:flagellar basal-body rod protein FlgG|nr:flagellar hook-basal body protein [Ruminococcus sp.]